MLFALVLTVLPFVDGAVGVGGFVLDHPNFLHHQVPEGELKARCANKFASYNPDSGLWIDYKHVWHHCPKGQ